MILSVISIIVSVKVSIVVVVAISTDISSSSSAVVSVKIFGFEAFCSCRDLRYSFCHNFCVCFH